MPQPPGRADPAGARTPAPGTRRPGGRVPGAAGEAAARRANVLRARRRMLGTLVALTLGAFVIALAQLAAVWVVVPPAVLLGFFLLLLREAARTDAERAHRHALAAACPGPVPE